MHVCVKKVTVEYAFNGKAYTVQFTDPMQLGAIVFSQIDLVRLVAAQSRESLVDPQMLHPVGPFPPEALATVTETGIDPDDTGASLWWHTTACAWFHPQT
jgi:hypothetical protein